MHLRLVCLSLLLAGLALSSSGCLAVAVGAGAAGTVAYMRGDLEAQEPYGIKPTYAATRGAIKELGLTIIEGETGQDALGARVTARDSSDKKVQVRLKAITSNATKLSIRVGTFGDNSRTQRIYSMIQEHLKAVAKTPGEAPQPAATPSESPQQPASTPVEPPPSTSTSTESPQQASDSPQPPAT
jgi:hypothetical protein